MHVFQQQFLDLIFQSNQQPVLQFGEFRLKSGRQSPYFFQAGALNNGAQLTVVGECLAATIRQHKLQFDQLFGPAYKGIPFVSTTAIALQRLFTSSYPWSFNRKTVKQHGEGGSIVGAALAGRVLIIDDVLTAGTAIKQSIGIIEAAGAEVCGIVTLLDRCEKTVDQHSTSQWLAKQYAIPVISVISIHDIVRRLQDSQQGEWVEKIQQHLQQHGC